jgi:acetyl-CoA carboxylase carboxyl transferase subunit alpha
MPELLEFEEPIGVLLKEIEALSMLPRTPERERSIESLHRRAEEIRRELYANLTPWQRVLVARHPSRPNTLDYVERLFTNFDELHGDRRFAYAAVIVAGADWRGTGLLSVRSQSVSL